MMMVSKKSLQTNVSGNFALKKHLICPAKPCNYAVIPDKSVRRATRGIAPERAKTERKRARI
jgi:hypothetical protein